MTPFAVVQYAVEHAEILVPALLLVTLAFWRMSRANTVITEIDQLLDARRATPDRWTP